MSQLALCLKALSQGQRPQPSHIEGAFEQLMDGDAPDAAIGGFLMGLAAIGETPDDIVAGARVLRGRMATINAPAGAIDTCGTGGDGKGAYNISTAAAIVAAGAGAIVAKHGNRAASSKSGSSDVLGELGVCLGARTEDVERSIREAGVGFLYAPAHHSAVRHVASARKGLGVRTLFNLLGPLANPAGAKRQLLGVFDPRWMQPMAQALRDLGCERAIIMCGQDGMDEITTTMGTDAVELRDGEIRQFEITPEDADIPRATETELQGGDPTYNAAAIQRLLDGETGAFRNIVLLNAGAALMLADRAADIREGAQLAASAIDDGRARRALDRMVTISNGGV
ncbi:MAG: anthranilate phosphoribosyltransferase [Maricaulis sp.]|jgi:anthranilate phosphoribosyltransferase|nr:anthranilate phosphoribosyltransferase [Maricaulis sp.]